MKITRRSSLGVIVVGALGILGSMAGLAMAFVANAFGRKRERPWIRVGAAEDLDTETFKKHVVAVERAHAWVRESVPLTVYVKDEYPEEPVALLATCTHLGCSVTWVPDHNEFRCPCHGGVYDEKGANVKGPPPRPLTRLEGKIEGEIFYVRQPPDGGRDA